MSWIRAAILIAASVALAGCGSGGGSGSSATPAPSAGHFVPHEGRWGIYSLELSTQAVRLIYGTPDELSSLALSAAGDRFAFAQKIGGSSNEDSEISSLSVAGGQPVRLTNNHLLDTYPAWSPDGSRIAFLSERRSSLDVYVMNADGSQARLLYGSSSNDADISWVGNRIAFTRDSQVWVMNADGSGAHRITDPPRAGQWGKANLPFGDYDPRISPDGTQVVFERLVGDGSPHGNYDLYRVGIDGSGLVRLTDSGYSQGLAAWSHSGSEIAYVVAAVDGAGAYDIYVMDSDGTGNRNVTPAFFPPEFLCHGVVFSPDDGTLYFIGEWWSAS
jgi:Tol biopolymer transport system component